MGRGQLVDEQIDFLAGFLFVFVGVENQGNAQAGMHVGPEHQQRSDDGTHPELARLKADKEMDVLLKPGKHFSQKALLRAVEFDEA
jgi:hypothetical protein